MGNSGTFSGIDSAQDVGGAPVLSTIITGNVVSENQGGGISVSASSQASQATYTIANNLIGADAAGTEASGNSGSGLVLTSVANASVLDNVILGNDQGLQLGQSGSAVLNDVIQGNWIGTDKSGQNTIGNYYGGLLLTNAIGVSIGGTGPGQGNVIANNNGNAIELDGGDHDPIEQNSIYNNLGQGILLKTHANDDAVAPTLSYEPGSGSNITLLGWVNGAPNQTYTVELFSDTTDRAAGFLEGPTFLTSETVTTDGSGLGSFSVPEPAGFYTATSTDASGNTSQFSTAAVTASQVSVTSTANPSTVGEAVTFIANLTNSASSVTPSGTVTFIIDGQAQPPVQIIISGNTSYAAFETSTLTAGSHSVSGCTTATSSRAPPPDHCRPRR